MASSDLTNFYKAQHSDIQGLSVTPELMLELAGQDLTPYCEYLRCCKRYRLTLLRCRLVPVPLSLGCPGLMNDNDVYLQYANFSQEVPTAVHLSGRQQPDQGSNLAHGDWYTATFL